MTILQQIKSTKSLVEKLNLVREFKNRSDIGRQSHGSDNKAEPIEEPKYSVGFEFEDSAQIKRVIKEVVLHEGKYYYGVGWVDGTSSVGPMTDESIETAIRVGKANKEYQEQLKQKRDAEEALKREKENTYGFVDEMPPHLKAKAVKALTKEIKIDGNVMMRKEMIKSFLENGASLGTLVGKNDKTIYKITNPYSKHDSYYEITKTEYDYGNYLLANVLNQEILVEGEPKSDDNESETALKTILNTLEDPQATYDDFKALEEHIALVENKENELVENETYKQVIEELQRLTGDPALDSLFSYQELDGSL